MLIAGCAGLPRVTPAVVAVAQRRDPAMDEATLMADRALYAQRCGSCHSVYMPDAYSSEKWPRKVDEMAARAKLKSGERDRLLRWLLATREVEGSF